MQSLNWGDWADVVQAASLILSELMYHFGDVKGEPGWQSRHGGYLCLSDGATGGSIFTTPIGLTRPDKAEKYKCLAEEKARRLAAHPDHALSWQSRNPAEEKWGGAVRVGPWILSFSGLPEMGDELFMFLLAAACFRSHISDLNIRQIAAVSQNPFMSELPAVTERVMQWL